MVRINYRRILQNHIFANTEQKYICYFHLKQECLQFHVQIAIGMRVEPPQNCYIAQIPGHTNYARSVRQPFPSNIGLRLSREVAVATIGPFQMLRSLCVIVTKFTILRHFLLKLWRNEILRQFIPTLYFLADCGPATKTASGYCLQLSFHFVIHNHRINTFK
jgi:hypothetical protein